MRTYGRLSAMRHATVPNHVYGRYRYPQFVGSKHPHISSGASMLRPRSDAAASRVAGRCGGARRWRRAGDARHPNCGNARRWRRTGDVRSRKLWQRATLAACRRRAAPGLRHRTTLRPLIWAPTPPHAHKKGRLQPWKVATAPVAIRRAEPQPNSRAAQPPNRHSANQQLSGSAYLRLSVRSLRDDAAA